MESSLAAKLLTEAPSGSSDLSPASAASSAVSPSVAPPTPSSSPSRLALAALVAGGGVLIAAAAVAFWFWTNERSDDVQDETAKKEKAKKGQCKRSTVRDVPDSVCEPVATADDSNSLEATSKSWADLVEQEEEEEIQVKSRRASENSVEDRQVDRAKMANNSSGRNRQSSSSSNTAAAVTERLASLNIANREDGDSNSGVVVSKTRKHTDSGVASPSNKADIVAVAPLTPSAASTPSHAANISQMMDSPTSSTSSSSSSVVSEDLPRPQGGGDVNGGRATSTSSSMSDSGQGSEAAVEDASVATTATASNVNSKNDNDVKEAEADWPLIYQFHMPESYCGKFIGVSGHAVKSIRDESGCEVDLTLPDGRKLTSRERRQRLQQQQQYNSNTGGDSALSSAVELYQVCTLTGPRANIEKCLDIIRKKFPLDQYPRLTLEQTNALLSDDASLRYLTDDAALVSPQTALSSGVTRPVNVSAVESAGHVFLQQPRHPLFRLLGRLEECMGRVYASSRAPAVPYSGDDEQGIAPGTVCAAYYSHTGQWCRAQVMSHDMISDTCTLKWLDWGGYSSGHAAHNLKQIRSDFLQLPFMAVECYLANVIPPKGEEAFGFDSAVALNGLVAGKDCHAFAVSLSSADMTPFVTLLAADNGDANAESAEPVSVNRLLVDRGLAQWAEGGVDDNRQ